MNAAHFHLVLTHFPIGGIFFALLLVGYAAYRNNKELNRLALGFVVLVALSGVPAYLSGEEAEDIVEDLSGISHDNIEEHEEAALPALIGLEVTGVFALAGLILYSGSKIYPKWFLPTLLVLVAVSAGLVAGTANLGGRIRHPEIEMHAKGEHP